MGDDDIRVNFGNKPPSKETEVVDEWEKEFEDGGDATVIDSDALKKLRETGGLQALSGEDTSLDGAAEEFDTGAPTVMEEVEPQVGAALLKAVDSGDISGRENTDFDEDSKTRMDPRVIPTVEVDAEAIGKEACPKCGVMVAAGYPKCPRCKHSLVRELRERAQTGGTSLVGGRTIPWTIVFIVAVLTIIIVYLAERDPVIESADDEAIESTTKSAESESE